jgi:hypothetical protein
MNIPTILILKISPDFGIGKSQVWLSKVSFQNRYYLRYRWYIIYLSILQHLWDEESSAKLPEEVLEENESLQSVASFESIAKVRRPVILL